MSLKQNDELFEQLLEAKAEADYFTGLAKEFLDNVVPQLSTPQLEWLAHELEVVLRERDLKLF
jgi:hypothetical protein